MSYTRFWEGNKNVLYQTLEGKQKYLVPGVVMETKIHCTRFWKGNKNILY